MGIVFWTEKHMSPLLNVDLFECGSKQLEEYDEGFKYLMHKECM